jgi:hypothetical protein
VPVGRELGRRARWLQRPSPRATPATVRV